MQRQGDGMTAHPVITVLVVSAVRLFRDGIGRILEPRPDIDVIGASATPEQAVPLVERASPNVLLLDLPAPEGIPFVRRVARSRIDVRVVVLGVSETDAEVVAWAEAGVAGYVHSDGSAEHLAAAILAAARGETLCSPRMTAALVRRLAARAAMPSVEAGQAFDLLTSRELQIVELIDRGLSNKEIAAQLCIELPTVKNHVHNILEKLHVERRGQAAALIRRPGAAAGLRSVHSSV
jgi:two-component system, NarL family, nitrate/nitrite response regulator NarL